MRERGRMTRVPRTVQKIAGGGFQGISLSEASAGTPTSDGASGASVVSNAQGGTLYWAIVTNNGVASNAQIIAGTGGDIIAAGSQVGTGPGRLTIATITGLSSATAYQIIFLQVVGNPVSGQIKITLVTV